MDCKALSEALTQRVGSGEITNEVVWSWSVAPPRPSARVSERT